MTVNLELFYPNQFVTELPPTVQEKAWTSSQNAATPQSRWQIYLNQLTLDVLIPLIEETEITPAELMRASSGSSSTNASLAIFSISSPSRNE